MPTLKVKIIGKQASPQMLEERVNEFLLKVDSEKIYQINYLQSQFCENGIYYTAVITYYE